jgi:uncharacterized membrane protein
VHNAPIQSEEASSNDGLTIGAEDGDAVLDREANRIALVVLVLVATVPLTLPMVLGQDPVAPQRLVFVVYVDGYVFVDYDVAVNQTYPTVNVTLFGATFEDLLVVDEHELPVDFAQIDNTILVSSLGASRLRITYFTADLTSKLGRVWTLAADVPINVTVELPEDASIVSLGGAVPEWIESYNGVVRLVMPPGLLELAYVTERPNDQPALNVALWAAAVGVPVVVGVLAYWRLSRRQAEPKETLRRVKVDEIFRDHGDLRPDEKEAIQFLAERNGRAYEAELFERLDIPRTSTWRLIKRLERMEIVEITKSRRQNIVSIQPEYLD